MENNYTDKDYERFDKNISFRNEKTALRIKYNLEYGTEFKYYSQAVEKLYLSGKNGNEVGDIFNCTSVSILCMLKKMIIERRPRGGAKNHGHLSKTSINCIVIAPGSHNLIANKYGISRQAVSYIKKYKTWSNSDERI